MGILFIAALVIVMATFAGYHFLVGLVVLGAGTAVSAAVGRLILGAPNSH